MHSSIQDRRIQAQLTYHRNADKLADRENLGRLVTVKDVYDIWERQGRKCFWSGVPVTLPTNERSLFQISLDRLDCSKAHTLDNMVVVCKGINLMRNNHTEVELLELIQAIRDVIV